MNTDPKFCAMTYCFTFIGFRWFRWQHFFIFPVLVFCITLSISAASFADSNSIDKVDHPYVRTQEKELSLRSFYQEEGRASQNHLIKHTLSFGKALKNDWLIEASISGKKSPDLSFDESSFEIEVKKQLTEQGEYSADYGLLFAYEKADDLNIEEVSVSVLAERQWHKWIGTINVKTIYEWGDDIKNEFETAFALQAKYRFKPSLEPTIEFYSGQFNKGIGPVLTGQKKIAPGKKLKWELGVIYGLDNESPGQTFRGLLKYEFR